MALHLARNGYRGLATHDILRLCQRDNRVVDVFVDCYGDWESASALEVYLTDGLDYPFRSVWRRPNESGRM